MKSRDFCYWLQGFFELTKDVQITPEQNTKIRNHLAMVFKHEIDPSFGGPEIQKDLTLIHKGGIAGVSQPGQTLMNC